MRLSCTLMSMISATRTLVLPTSRTCGRVLLFAFFSIITLAPLTMVHSQFVTGPLVNAMLILTCALVGPVEAMVLSLFPSPVALMSGLLPLPLAPMIPFIMIGNALYVAAFHYLAPRGRIVGLVVGSFLKFLFLATAVRFVMVRLLAAPLVANLAVMMGWPQLVTALIGGGVALGLLLLFPGGKKDQ